METYSHADFPVLNANLYLETQQTEHTQLTQGSVLSIPQTASGVNDGKRIDRQMDRPRVNDMAVEIGS
jgi:hypothetical protein